MPVGVVLVVVVVVALVLVVPVLVVVAIGRMYCGCMFAHRCVWMSAVMSVFEVVSWQCLWFIFCLVRDYVRISKDSRCFL